MLHYTGLTCIQFWNVWHSDTEIILRRLFRELLAGKILRGMIFRMRCETIDHKSVEKASNRRSEIRRRHQEAHVACPKVRPTKFEKNRF